MAEIGAPLPSWNDGPAKAAIVDFVARVTKSGGPGFVPAPARIATFDNDGTLWCEQPLQAQVFFALDRLKGLAAKDPTMKDRQPYKAFLELDLKTTARAREESRIRGGVRDSRRGDGGRVRPGGAGVARVRAAPQAWAAFHAVRLPAAARAARLPSRQRLQDVYRLGRRNRPDARLRRRRVRHPARAGDRLEREDPLRGPGRPRRAGQARGARQLRRPGGQAGEHPAAYRQAADPRLRQLGRGSCDAALRQVRRRPFASRCSCTTTTPSASSRTTAISR